MLRLPIGSFLAALLSAASLAAQADYTEEKLTEFGIKLPVHKKLSRLPMQLGHEEFTHLKAKYEPKDEGDFIFGRRGTYRWYLEFYDFPKFTKAEKSDDPKKALKDAAVERGRAANFKEFVQGDKDRGSSDRRFVVKDKEMPAKNGKLGYRWWEYFDSQKMSAGGEPFDQIWYKMTAVFDLADRELAICLDVPVQKGDRPHEKHMGWAKLMLANVALLDEKAASAVKSDKDKANEAKKDALADTPERKASLERAKKNIAGLKGWDYFASQNYAVLFSWDHEKPEKRQAMEAYARDLTAKLEKMRLLYQENYPPHERFVKTYSVMRICYSIEQFQQYGNSGGGVVGWFNPGTKELVFFKGDVLMGSGATETVAFHEGWHQYADCYFRKAKKKPAGSEKKEPDGKDGKEGGTVTEIDLEELMGSSVELHRWFDEGTGDFFGSYVWNGSKWTYFASKMRKGDIKVIVNTGKHVPLREIVTWNKDRFYGANASDYYAQAYSMIDFFRRGKSMGSGWDDAWGKILEIYRERMLENGDGKKAVEAAFQGVDWDKLEASWIRWVKEYLK